jgi:hypothetical protein
MGGDACEDIGQPSLRIDTIHLGRDDQAIHGRGALSATIRPAEEPGLSPKRRVSQVATDNSYWSYPTGITVTVHLIRPGIPAPTSYRITNLIYIVIPDRAEVCHWALIGAIRWAKLPACSG